MKHLAVEVGTAVLATVVVGLVCGLVASQVLGGAGFVAALAAVMVSLPAAVTVVVYFFLQGIAAASIVAGTLLRVGLTGVAALLAVVFFPGLRGPAFLLSLAAVYVVNLVVETWMVYEKNRQWSGFSRPVDPSMLG